MSNRLVCDDQINDILDDDVSTIKGGEETHPTGSLDNFMEVRKAGGYLADKSMLIDRILSDRNNKVFLFCRPRRFGKSINLTMLDAYLNVKYQGNKWFDGMFISECGRHDDIRNSFPVIYLNMKTVSDKDSESVARRFGHIVHSAYRAHHYLETSEKLPEFMRRYVSKRLDYDLSEFEPEDLATLSEMLHLHHGVPVVVLIDEYDAPVHSALGMEHYADVIRFMRGMLTPLLKDNPHVYKAVLVGVLRVAKESLFSGLNNLVVSGPLEGPRFADCFGMTEDDVIAACEEAGHPEKLEEIREHYDGYRIAGTDIYNPYSVMNYFGNSMKADGYWVGTSHERDFEILLSAGNPDVNDAMIALVSGKSVRVELDRSMAFPNSGRLDDMDTKGMFTLMVQSGYLTADSVEDGRYDIRVPNKEVMDHLRGRVRNWFGDEWARVTGLLGHLLSGDGSKAESNLMMLVENPPNGRAISHTDSVHSLHQLLITGMLSVHNNYIAVAEYHSGDWVSDIAVLPRNGSGPSVVIELKEVPAGGDLEETVMYAMRQIESKRYTLGVKGDPVRACGIAIGSDGVAVRIS